MLRASKKSERQTHFLMITFVWVLAPCKLTVDDNVSENRTIFIFRAEALKMVKNIIVTTLKTTNIARNFLTTFIQKIILLELQPSFLSEITNMGS